MDYARLAAYIDGEGNIELRKASIKAGKRRGKYAIRVKVTNTDFRLIKWLLDNFGGAFFPFDKPKYLRKSVLYDWYVSGKCAGLILERCLPYFISKSEQAELAIEFRSTFSKLKDTRPLDPAVSKKRDELIVKIKIARHSFQAPVAGLIQ